MPDPFVLHVDGIWYAFATAAGPLEGGSGSRALRLLRSTDFERWERCEGPLVAPPEAVGCSIWAPEVARGDDGRFYLYYSFGREQDQQHRLRVAVSDHPDGPYEDAGIDLVDPATQPFAIDPHPFRDDDGSWWLYYARNFVDQEDGAHVGTGLVVDRLPSMTRLAGQPTTILRPRHAWTLFEADRDVAAYGGRFDWHTIEGPFVEKHAGRYWLTYSGGNYGGPSYGVGVASAHAPTGPFVGDFASPTLLSTPATGLRGPGHHSITRGPDGRDWIAFHAWDAEATRRQMHLAPLRWDAQAGPSLA